MVVYSVVVCSDCFGVCECADSFPLGPVRRAGILLRKSTIEPSELLFSLIHFFDACE